MRYSLCWNSLASVPGKLPLADIWEPIARNSGNGLAKTGAYVFFLLNINYEFEDGSIPVPIRAIMVSSRLNEQGMVAIFKLRI
jgi:hypothetical protein